MNKDTLVTLIVTGTLLFVWLPALILSVRRAMRKNDSRPSRTDRESTHEINQYNKHTQP